MKYDYSLFPKMESGYLIIPKPCEGLKSFNEIYDRFCSAIYMASMISEKAGKYIITSNTQHCAYVRATLTEFASIEECIQQLFPELAVTGYKLHMSNNPAFHFLKLLRNYNIHLSESTLAEKAINVALASEPDTEYDLQVFYIDNLKAEEILKLRTAKHYTKDEIIEFIRYFEESQHKFGVSNLLINIVVQYSEYISKSLTSGSSSLCLDAQTTLAT